MPGWWASSRPWLSRPAVDSPGRAGDRLRAPEPAITSAIIDRRTMDHFGSQLTATEVDLGADAIDAIDAPGAILDPAADGWVPSALQPADRRH